MNVPRTCQAEHCVDDASERRYVVGDFTRVDVDLCEHHAEVWDAEMESLEISKEVGGMIGRRVKSIAEIERPGDYCGPIKGQVSDPDLEACFFLLPNARDEGARGGQRAIHHVVFPPHTYRECADGSLEIRASIGAMPFWHGYLDEGHVWRTV